MAALSTASSNLKSSGYVISFLLLLSSFNQFLELQGLGLTIELDFLELDFLVKTLFIKLI